MTWVIVALATHFVFDFSWEIQRAVWGGGDCDRTYRDRTDVTYRQTYT